MKNTDFHRSPARRVHAASPASIFLLALALLPACARLQQLRSAVSGTPRTTSAAASNEPVASAAAPVDRTESEAVEGDELTPPPVPSGVALDVALATTTTHFDRGGDDRSRAHNVELATRKLNGHVIAPHATFSFNETIGPRDGAHGFRIAHVIMDGELVDGWGGGTCQVASTLHASALRAGLDIVESRPHSRKSRYLPYGYDATVVWPSVDLKVRNPFPYPVLIEATTEEGELTVTLVGERPAPRVNIEAHVVRRMTYGERMVDDETLAPGATVVSQEGRDGVIVRRARVIADGITTSREERVLVYPPVDRIVHRGTWRG